MNQGDREFSKQRRLPLLIAVGAMLTIPTLMVALLRKPPGGHDHPAWIGSVSNLHQIGLGILIYQSENGGRYPNDLGQLYTFNEGKLSPNVFVSPGTADEPAVGPTTQAVAANLLAGGHCSYIYLGKGMTEKTPPTAVAAYEPPQDHDGRAVVLFADGHCECLEKTASTSLEAKLKSAMTKPVIWP